MTRIAAVRYARWLSAASGFVGPAGRRGSWSCRRSVGIDEWDHAYRAGAVAHGQWRADAVDRPPGGRVRLVSRAGTRSSRQPAAECERLPYTAPSRVRGHALPVAGTAAVASGRRPLQPGLLRRSSAIRRAPVRRASAALYAMRVVAALASLALLVSALGSMLPVAA